MSVKPIPDGFHSVTPYLVIKGVPKLIDFLKQAFDGKEIDRVALPDGTIGHAEVKIGDSIVMMGEARGGCEQMPSALYLYVPDTDATYRRALKAGGISKREPADQFYGDRSGGVTDPFGNIWWIATHIEDISRAELQKRAETYRKG